MRIFVKKYARQIVAAVAALLLTGAVLVASNPIGRYLLVQGYHQLKVLAGARSIARILSASSLDSETRKKLLLVGEIKRFGLSLGLEKTGAYETVFDNGKGPVVWAVTACPKDRLEAVTWKFPVAGRVPYLGFFKKEDARKALDGLKSKGYDALMRPVSAYSTLGILPDPLFTSMLMGSEEYLADLILHEMTHATVYLKGDAGFNESFATFVGMQGGLDFLKFRYGENSPEVGRSLDYKEDDERFSAFMAGLYDRLDRLYKSSLSTREKLSGREKIFEEAKEEFNREVRPGLKSGAFDAFDRIPLNNAYIILNRKYHRDVGIFEELYKANGNDLGRTVAFVKSVKKEKDPAGRIREETARLKGGR
jgi:predicted aminopeptidase